MKSLGAYGEDLAVRELQREGYRILERNAVLGRYELDVIAEEGDTIAFVEVKTRRGTDGDTFEPADNVHHVKQTHIRAAARWYLCNHYDPDRYYRYDVVSVVVPTHGRPQVEILRDAFRDDD